MIEKVWSKLVICYKGYKIPIFIVKIKLIAILSAVMKVCVCKGNSLKFYLILNSLLS